MRSGREDMISSCLYTLCTLPDRAMHAVRMGELLAVARGEEDVRLEEGAALGKQSEQYMHPALRPAAPLAQTAAAAAAAQTVAKGDAAGSGVRSRRASSKDSAEVELSAHDGKSDEAGAAEAGDSKPLEVL